MHTYTYIHTHTQHTHTHTHTSHKHTSTNTGRDLPELSLEWEHQILLSTFIPKYVLPFLPNANPMHTTRTNTTQNLSQHSCAQAYHIPPNLPLFPKIVLFTRGLTHGQRHYIHPLVCDKVKCNAQNTNYQWCEYQLSWSLVLCMLSVIIFNPTVLPIQFIQPTFWE